MATNGVIAGIALVKDERDIIAETLTHMSRQVDYAVVVDNASTDGTRQILDDLVRGDLRGFLWVRDDLDPAYYQSRKMSALAAEVAAVENRFGCPPTEWILPFDADEIWRSRVDGMTIAEALRSLPAHVHVAEAPLFDHVATGVDPDGPPVQRMGWRRPEPAPLRKVACRAVEGLVIHQGNHAASFPGVAHPAAVTDVLEVRHFPYRSIEQFCSKAKNGAAAYAATDLPEQAGAHWRSYGRILDEHGEEGIADVFMTWFYRQHPDRPLRIGAEHQPPLVFDPVPVAASS